MKKYRIIEEYVPLCWGYLDESSELPKELEYSKPIILLEERKSIFHKWKFVKQFDTIKQAEFYVYNQKIENVKSITKVITTL